MIKKISGLIFALFIFGNLSAQNNYKADQRLTECLGQAYVSELENSNSELISYYNYYLENSYYAVDIKSAEKEITGTDIHSVLLQTDKPGEKIYFMETTYVKENFNPLKYQFNLSANSFTTYLWKEAGVAIVFYPLSQISANFKESLKSQTK